MRQCWKDASMLEMHRAHTAPALVRRARVADAVLERDNGREQVCDIGC